MIYMAIINISLNIVARMWRDILLVFLSNLKQVDLQAQDLVLPWAFHSLAWPHRAVRGCQTL